MRPGRVPAAAPTGIPASGCPGTGSDGQDGDLARAAGPDVVRGGGENGDRRVGGERGRGEHRVYRVSVTVQPCLAKQGCRTAGNGVADRFDNDGRTTPVGTGQEAQEDAGGCGSGGDGLRQGAVGQWRWGFELGVTVKSRGGAGAGPAA